ncbi:sugar ABC transporter permease [Spirochaetia bacterium]|nr:sugar ABC transporter permease [Spirochaetia bacterium]
MAQKPGILKNRDNIAFAYIAPWLIGFLVLQLYPLLASLYYSFTDYTMMKRPSLVGIKNYIDMFTNDVYFFKSLKATFLYVLYALPAKLAFALIIAVILNQNIRGINIFRTVYYLPSILGGSVAVSILWRFIFMRDGLLNTVLTSLYHYERFDWIGNPATSLPVLAMLQVWQFGSSMVLFLAGLQQIPQAMYESAEIDGASALTRFFRITLPMLSPIILFNLIMQMVQLFQEFTAAFIITPNGGGLKTTYVYGMMIYQNAFQFFRMGYASAQSWILFVVIISLTLIIFRLSDDLVHYEDK